MAQVYVPDNPRERAQLEQPARGDEAQHRWYGAEPTERHLGAIDLAVAVAVLAAIALLRQIQQALEVHFSNEEAWAQLETAVSWGRYAELFTYHEDSGIFELEEPGTA